MLIFHIIFRDHHEPSAPADEFVAAISDSKETKEIVDLLNAEQIALWGDDWDEKGCSYWSMQYSMSSAAEALSFASGFKKNY